jgi:hypothetical protein
MPLLELVDSRSCPTRVYHDFRCLARQYASVSLSWPERDALWARFFTGAPRAELRQSQVSDIRPNLVDKHAGAYLNAAKSDERPTKAVTGWPDLEAHKMQSKEAHYLIAVAAIGDRPQRCQTNNYTLPKPVSLFTK